MVIDEEKEEEDAFNSIKGVGRVGPEINKFITLQDVAKIPCGKALNTDLVKAGFNQGTDF